MIPQRRAFLFGTLLFIGTASLHAQDRISPDGKTIAYLARFRTDYVRAMREKKLEVITPYYADNVRLMVEFQKTMIGKDNVSAYHTAFSNRLDIKSYSRTEAEILDLGAQVVEYGLFTMRAILKSVGKEYVLDGKYQTIWKKGEKGELSLITEGWNYDQRSDIGEQLKFAAIPVVDVALRAHTPINNNISFELAALNRLQEATVSEHDPSVWSQFYAEDAILYAQYQPVQKGRKAINAFFEQHVKDIPIFEKLDIRNDQIDELGKYVLEYASHIAIIRSGDFSGVFTGKDLAIWRREPNGSLKIFRHMAMYD